MKYLTIKQVESACEKHEYILVRYSSGYNFGVNCRISKIIAKKYRNKNLKTDFVSFKPCNFMEYISKKHAFIKSD